MKVLYSDDERFTDSSVKSLFTAGPTPRDKDTLSWRPEAISILEKLNFDGTVLVPERRDWAVKFSYDDQVEWEKSALSNCTAMIFWVPRKFPSMKALTTNVEFGYWIVKKPTQLFYARPDDAEQIRYLDYMYFAETGRTAKNTLEDVLKEAVDFCNQDRRLNEINRKEDMNKTQRNNYFYTENGPNFSVLIKNENGQPFVEIKLDENQACFDVITKNRADIICNLLNYAKENGGFGLTERR